MADREYTATEWRRALQGLTPGGSEFITPEECAAYVRRKTQYPRMIIELRERNTRLDAAIQIALEKIILSHAFENSVLIREAYDVLEATEKAAQ